MTDNENKNSMHKDIDPVTGVETTGHEWDGLKELNKPAPRWWLWVFYATVIWSVGYWVVYPAWPTLSGHTKGTLGWTQYTKLKSEQAEIDSIQAKHAASFKSASLEDILRDEKLYAFAVAGGRAAFKTNCATCHGTGAQGGKGYPNLNDDDWIWGGKVSDIYQTLQYGIRSGHDEARISQMPAFGRDGLLKQQEIKDAADYVIALSKGEAKAEMPGAKIYAENCASCHGEAGAGMREVGAPKLADAIWLYGGDPETVYTTIYNARAGVMPQWKGRLPDDTVRMLAVYVHSLGGGEADEAPVEATDVTQATESTAATGTKPAATPETQDDVPTDPKPTAE